METLTEPVAPAPDASILLVVDEQSQIGAARRSALALGHAQNISAEHAGRVAIIVTEAATNILRHGGHGVIVLRALTSQPTPVIEVLALDNGPGIPNVGHAMRDGYSTAGTAGEGLGAMQRLADLFEMHSQPGKGTALVARVGHAPRPSSTNVRRTATLDDRVGVVCVALRGQVACGDAWRMLGGPSRLAVLLADGLGHGPDAAAVARTATTTFAKSAGQSPDVALAALDAAIRGSRGAAVSMAVIDESARTIRFGGVGNVDGRVLTAGPTDHLVPQNGIVGHTMPVVRPTTTSWPVGARLVMHSDGISSRWRLDAYDGLSTAHPALIAGVIYRDFGRNRDDVTVLVVDDRVAEARE